MSDMGDYWRDVVKARQESRAHHRECSPNMLTDAKITFEVKNGGAHLIVQSPDGLIDFWPGTGRWMVRGNCRSPSGFGVRKLIKHVHGQRDAANKATDREEVEREFPTSDAAGESK